jgi:glutaredoxin
MVPQIMASPPGSLPRLGLPPKMPPMMPQHAAIIYTRSGCHLCEEAEALLVRYGIRPQRIDIDADTALQDRYNLCVPVVVIDGKERFRGQVNEVLLKRILAERRD